MKRCPECFVAEGELHKDGCAVEECPVCGGQAIECYCPITHEDDGTWSILSFGANPRRPITRIPFLWFPRVCMRCGKVNPRLFHVPDEEWQKYVPPSVRGQNLCLKCYNEIRGIQDAKGTACGAVDREPGNADQEAP